MQFIYDDGGRKAAGFKGKAGDCVCRAIAIAAQLPYRKVYDALMMESRVDRTIGAIRGKIVNSSPRTRMLKSAIHRCLTDLGWTWIPTMHIGSGCTTHLRSNELPAGRLIVSVSRHMVAVIDGVIHDTFDPSRNGTRCVYGYWRKS